MRELIRKISAELEEANTQAKTAFQNGDENAFQYFEGACAGLTIARRMLVEKYESELTGLASDNHVVV